MKKARQEDVRCLSLFCLFAFEKVSIVGHVLILKSQFLREWIVMEKKNTQTSYSPPLVLV